MVSNDEYLTHIVVDMTIGDVIRRVERCRRPRGYLLFKLVRDAVIELDVGALEQIIKRVDGLAPNEDEMDGVANVVGDALNDILDYDDIDQIRRFDPNDPVVIIIAKALYIIAVRECGNNVQKRKDKAKAMDIIFSRTGGRKIKPVPERIETVFKDPDWMKGELPA